MTAKRETVEIIDGLTELLRGRGHVYELLRRMFLLGPTVELLADLLYMAAVSREDNEAVCPAWERGFSNYLRQLRPDMVGVLCQELKTEFTRLFIGPRRLPAPPYEAVYRSPERSLMQAVTMEVREQYRGAGLEVKKLNNEPDDHIGLEFEFMYHLNVKALAALQREDLTAMFTAVDQQERFLTEHLSQWVPLLCDDVAANTFHEFFRRLAQFVKGFIVEDCVQAKQLRQAGREIW